MARLVTAALAVGFLWAATPATATTYDRMTVAEVTAVFQSAGFSVSSTSNSAVFIVGGVNVRVVDCKSDGKCTEICFYANLANVQPSAQKVNEWNQTKKIPEASRNADGTLHVEMWLSTIGATDTNIIDMFKWFRENYDDKTFWTPSTS